MKIYFNLLFVIFSCISLNAQNIDHKQIYNIIRNYPESNYIGSWGMPIMKPMANRTLRDFGVYRKAKINITPIKHIKNEIIVEGKLFIFEYLKGNFTGKIEIIQINSNYEQFNTLNEKNGDLIRDSILTNIIKGRFVFNIEDEKEKEYKGNISFIVKNKEKEWILNESGIVLYGNLNDNSLNFGYIIPPSSGIFRSQFNSDKSCVNKNLLKYGWQSYLYSHPEYFDCIFDSFSDKVENITFDDLTVNKNIELENSELQ